MENADNPQGNQANAAVADTQQAQQDAGAQGANQGGDSPVVTGDANVTISGVNTTESTVDSAQAATNFVAEGSSGSTGDDVVDAEVQSLPPVSIHPTVGRMVWYWPTYEQVASRGFAQHGLQPFAAQIAYVHDDYKVNLSVVDHNGTQFAATDVNLLTGSELTKPDGAFAEWMGYQLGQARAA